MARAADTVAFYTATWGSMPAATLTLSLAGDGGHYRDTIKAVTLGLSWWLLHFRTEVEATGTLGPDGAARPARYHVYYDLRHKRDQHIALEFVTRDGTLVAERAHDDTSRRPPLPEQFRRGIVDPMSAFATIREHLRGRAMKAGDRFVLPVFDDTRRYDVRVTVAAVDERTKLIQIHLDLVPIAGFTDKKKAGRDSEDAPRPIEMTFRNDATLLPTRLEVAVGWLPLVVSFDHLCADAAHCTAEKAAKK
jgi:hypothetical protein